MGHMHWRRKQKYQTLWFIIKLTLHELFKVGTAETQFSVPSHEFSFSQRR